MNPESIRTEPTTFWKNKSEDGLQKCQAKNTEEKITNPKLLPHRF